jgi:tetrapyrrole methylase family protein/MazG family protein
VYAVPGHPLVGERSVEIIVRKAASLGLEIKIEGSMSFIESCLEALAVSIGKGLVVLDALEIDSLSPTPSLPNMIYQVYSRQIASDVKLRLMEFYPDEYEVYVITGTPEGPQVQKVPLFELDWREFDHLASVFVPTVG